MGQPIDTLHSALQIAEMRSMDDIGIVFTSLHEHEEEKLHEERFGQAEVQRATSHELVDGCR